MLVSFSCGNFLSYDSVQTLSLRAGKKLRTKKDHLLRSKGAGNVLKFAAIYGANSAGKSNLFRAMDVVRKFVLSGHLVQNSPELYCRVREENGKKPSFFEICFLVDDVPHTYGMEIDMRNRVVLAEWLFFAQGEERQYLFRKESADSGITFGSVLADCAEIQVLANIFSGGESPFLYCMNHNTASFYKKNPKAQILQRVYEWFARQFEVIYPEQPISDTALLDDSETLQEYARYLKMFGTGIVAIEEEAVSEDKVKSHLSAADRMDMEIRMNLARTHNLLNREKRTWSAVVRNRATIFTIRVDTNGAAAYHALKFVHQYGDERVAYEMRRESDGTYRLFQLLDVLMTAKDRVFVIDEISRCMHPLLTIKFVETFLSLAAERNVQLVVTTHETRLMRHEFLRRDEVWVCDNERGASELSSFDAKQVRIDKVMDQNYMEGALGGVPNLG